MPIKGLLGSKQDKIISSIITISKNIKTLLNQAGGNAIFIYTHGKKTPLPTPILI
ncbi:hypothetical protein DSUL_20103 [Desulfovibrionales bacterium]